jgi:hypothetical protein
MSVYCAEGGPDREIGPRKKVLVVPPDQTRAASRAGELTHCAWRISLEKPSTRPVCSQDLSLLPAGSSRSCAANHPTVSLEARESDFYAALLEASAQRLRFQRTQFSYLPPPSNSH